MLEVIEMKQRQNQDDEKSTKLVLTWSNLKAYKKSI